MYNQGDTISILLDYTIDDVSLVEYEPDEIEFYIGGNRYTLTGGDIAYDTVEEKYAVRIEQSESFEFSNVTKYQIRIQKGGNVVSSGIQRMLIGASISRTVI